MTSTTAKGDDAVEAEVSGDVSAGKESLYTRIGAFFVRYGLDTGTLKQMFKGSLPPTIGIAMYQSTAVSNHFTTLGFEIPVVTVLAMAILPRGKYLQNLALNLAAVCLGSAVALLTLWTAFEACRHTSSPAPVPTAAAAAAAAPQRPTYSSSQSAVCALWLFVNIWAANFLRAKLPSFNLPAIIFSILTSIACTSGPLMASWEQARLFVRLLLTSMLVALAIATCVSLFVFPTTSRDVVFKQFSGAVCLLKKSVILQGAYLQKLEHEDMYALEPVETAVGTNPETERLRRNTRKHADAPEEAAERAAAKELRTAIAQLSDLGGKMHVESQFAKREIAWGKLDAKELGALFDLFRRIFIPVVGLSTVMDILRRASRRRGGNFNGDASVENHAEEEGERHTWNTIMKQLHDPFRLLSEAMGQGLEHAALQLGLFPRPKTGRASSKQVPGAETDVEARDNTPLPGQAEFTRVLNDKAKLFYRTKGETLRAWARERAMPESADGSGDGPAANLLERRRAQLCILLYLEQLMHAAGEAVEDLVEFADNKVADGTMKRNRLIFPARRRLRKWMASIFNAVDSAAAESQDVFERGPRLVRMGESFGQKRDPEHLPPVNWWQRTGQTLRSASELVGSEESMFGLRCSCATMTVAIACFLERTQAFFQEQRLVWAMIIIAIGMTRTSGQSTFGFFCRVGGSLVAMVLCYVIWYMGAETIPGIMVFLWLSIFCSYYFLLKFPRFIPASMIVIITQALIIGYELQVRKIGVAAAEQTGQPYYPIYLLAPYRLATVAGACLVAFVWTVFPSPLTDRAWLRRDISGTLYLLANYFSAINETMKSAVRDRLGKLDVPGTPANQLLRIRQKLFSKLTLLLPSLQAHANWQKWEPAVGGRFPKEAYDDIILRSNRILNYLTLISYTVTWRSRHATATPDGPWQGALSELVAQLAPTHYSILSTLTLLSNSLLSGHSLPPHIPVPWPYGLSRRLHLNNTSAEETWQDGGRGDSGTSAGQATATTMPSPGGFSNVLDTQNWEARGYAEFAVLQVCAGLVCDDLEGLVRAVSGLVGVVDFSFRVEVDGGGSDPGLSPGGRAEVAYKGKGKAD